MTDEEILQIDFYDLLGSQSAFMTNYDKIKYYRQTVENRLIMRDPKDILKDASDEAHSDQCSSWNVIALMAIRKAQKEMFDFLYSESQLEENNNLSLLEFFDKMDMQLDF